VRFGRPNPLWWALCLAPALYAQDALPGDAPDAALTGTPLGTAAVIPTPRNLVRTSFPGLTPADWTLLGAAAGLRYLDYQTTLKALSDPADFHEVELPQKLVDCHPALAAFEAGTVAANFWIYRALARHGHRRVARAGQVVNVGALGGTVAFNEYNLAKDYRHKSHQ
jgi:hypothetical protein